VIEKRNHIAGNCYDYKDENNILIHKYGPHLFHTNNKEVFEYWYWFVDMMKWKLNDIKVQREIESEIRKIALETSFGESNTNLELKDKYGILVKRQNGSQIQPIEINQIKESWVKVQSVFGGLSHIALNDNLKISHTADKYCYASKAAGMYIPKMKTIAVSNKYGFEKFECIMAHETAHYIDNRLGESKGERYSTDNFEGTAGTIAGNFRKLMNKKSDSDYINSTKECFARALEQYFAIEVFGEDVSYYESKATGEILYFDAESYVNKVNFDGTMKPLIKKFLDEEQTFFKYLVELNDEIPTKTETKEKPNEIEKAIETFEMLVNLGGTDAELKEWNEAIETFKMLVGTDKIKNGGDVEDDFDYMSFYKEETPKELELRLKEQQISEEQQKENEYQKNNWDKKYAPTYKDAIKKTVQSYFDAKKTLEDWGSRQYKLNKGVVFTGGDDIHGNAFTIGSINEYRRKRTMAGAKMLMDESIESLKELGLNDTEIDELLKNKE
jgi:hypothetical protein